MDQIPVKYSAPTKYDPAEFKSMVKVMLDEDLFDFYIQVSQNPNEPTWEKVSLILIKSIIEIHENEPYLKELISMI